jgi:ABC-type glycerol-3-phosphate transport system permease component
MPPLLVAAVPTLLVFLFCQRIILRGIVIPVEK